MSSLKNFLMFVIFFMSFSSISLAQPVPIMRSEVILMPKSERLKCMALNIYHEARNQSIKGQIAVAMVTLNRVKSKKFPSKICEVVYQEHQFSWFWDGEDDEPREVDSWNQSILVASAVLSKESAIIDTTKGALFYHAEWMDYYPKWSKRFTKVAHVEEHIFYKD